MDGDGRDTIPGCEPGELSCEHCGCSPVNGDYALGVVMQCATCDHPGEINHDRTGELAWFLRAGRCNDHKCADCYPEHYSRALEMAAELEQSLLTLDGTLLGPLDADSLVGKARDLALSLRIAPSAALRLLVNSIYRDLDRARENVASAERLASRQLELTRHVAVAAHTFAREELS